MNFLEKYGIRFDNMELLEIALTHSSYSNEHGGGNYERLEFLGDAVLELIASDYIYHKDKHSEGEMSRKRSLYVCENALYEYSMDLGIYRYIKVGHGEEKEGGKYKKAILSDIFEAIIGAIYLDLGYATARRTALNIIVPYIENPNKVFFSDYKSSLQEYVQTEQKTIFYDIVKEEGPAHNKTFTIEVKIDDIVYGRGSAGSKKEAEQNAAKEAMEKLAK